MACSMAGETPGKQAPFVSKESLAYCVLAVQMTGIKGKNVVPNQRGTQYADFLALAHA